MTQWQHYIGGFYTPDKFVEETKRQGASRRCAPNVASAMAYGDLVHCLAWNAGEATCFATLVVHGVSAQEEIARVVATDLAAEGKCREMYSQSNVVVRACGSYVSSVHHVVTAELSEVVERLVATGKAMGVKPVLLIRGTLRDVYDPPKALPAGTRFFRGFRKVRGAGEPLRFGSLTGVSGYRVRSRVKHDDFAVTVPLPSLTELLS